MFCPFTPNSSLRKRLQEAEELISNTNVCRIKMVERSGPTIGDLLIRKTPWLKDHCGRKNCAPCDTKPGKCKSPNISYRITCQTCKVIGVKATYIGESSRTFFDRAKDHTNALKAKNSKYGIVKHWMECHPLMEEPPKFSFNLIKSHKSAMDRQIFEALAIEAEDCQISMNNKAEFGRNFIPRMINNPDTSPWEEGPKSNQSHSQKSKRDASGFVIPSDSNGNVRVEQRFHSETHKELFSQ